MTVLAMQEGSRTRATCWSGLQGVSSVMHSIRGISSNLQGDSTMEEAAGDALIAIRGT